MKNVMVTGGAGFIGSNFVRMLIQQRNYNIVVYDLLTYAGNIGNLEELINDGAIAFVKKDICKQNEVEEILEKYDIDTVVNFAAESHVDRSITGPGQFIETNINGTYSLLESCRKLWSVNQYSGKHFHHVSTDEVYGSLDLNEPAFKESNQYLPNSPYAASKAASDHLVRAYHHTYGLPVTTSNCSNNYGRYQFPEKLLPLCLINILNGKSLPIYGKGDQIRDWLHVDDHNTAILKIIENGVKGQVYNIGGNNEWKNLDVVKALCAIVDKIFMNNPQLREKYPSCPASQGRLSEELITFVQDRLGHDTRYAIDATKIGLELNFYPTIAFKDGLKDMVNWYLENKRWWLSIIDGSYKANG